MKNTILLALLLLAIGCTGGNISEDEASSLALERYLSNHPTGNPRISQVGDLGSDWLVELDAGNTSPKYWVDKGSGKVTVTPEYALEIAMTDPNVKAIYTKYAPMNTLIDPTGNYWVIRFVTGNTEVMIVTIDTSTEQIVGLKKNIHEF